MIETKTEQKVSLSVSSDDGIKIWLNSKEVLAKSRLRGAAAGQENVEITLKPGRNELLMKIVNGGGISGFYLAASSVTQFDLPGKQPRHHIGPFTTRDFNVAFDQVFAPEQEIDLTRKYNEGKLAWSEQPE